MMSLGLQWCHCCVQYFSAKYFFKLAGMRRNMLVLKRRKLFALNFLFFFTLSSFCIVWQRGADSVEQYVSSQARPRDAVVQDTILVASKPVRVCQERQQSFQSVLHNLERNDVGKVFDTQLFQQWLCEQQHAANNQSHPIYFVDDDPTAGFGSRMLRIASAFLTSLNFHRPLAFPRKGRWLYSKCFSKNNDCYFAPVTSAGGAVSPSQGAIQREVGVLVPGDARRELWTRGSLTAFYQRHGQGVTWSDNVLRLSKVLDSKRGSCWLIAQLLFYLVEPNQRVASIVEREKKRLGWGQQPVAAIHVRHGDRAQRGHQGSNLQLEDFVAKLAAQAPHVKHILLMTEDGKVVEQARSNFLEYTFFVTELQPRTNDSINKLLAQGKLDAELEMHNALANLYMAIDCAYFFGHLTSTWGRLVLLLSYAKYGCFQGMELMGSSWHSRWEFSSCTSEAFARETAIYPCNSSALHDV